MDKNTANSDLWQTSDRYLSHLYKLFDDDLTLDVTSPNSGKVKYVDNLVQESKLRLNMGDKRINSDYYFTELENCLIQDFIVGNWFMNPPFSNPLEFLEKFVYEILKSRHSSGVVLLKSGCIHNIGTSPIIWNCAKAICFHSPRLEFVNSSLNAVNGADFDCVSVYFGADSMSENFCDVFSNLGECRMIN